MGNDVRIVITSQDDSDIEAPKRKVKALGDEATIAGVKIKGMGKDAEDFGRTSMSSSEAARAGLQKLDDQISQLKATSSNLRTEFTKTGDVDFLKGARNVDGAIKDLEKFRNEFKKVTAEADKEGQSWGKSLGTGVLSGLQQGLNAVSGAAPTGFVQWLVAGAVAAAPLLLATLNGAMLAGAGTIGIASAIAVQARDPQIGAAYSDLGHRILADLTDATSSFKQPLLETARDFRADWEGVLPGLRNDWAMLAPYVEQFAQGIAGLVSHSMPGFNALIQQSGPELQILAQELPRVGDAISNMFDSMSKGGKGAAQALEILMKFIEGDIVLLGKLTEYGSKAFEWANRISPVGQLFTYLTDKSDKTQRSFQMLGSAGEEATVKLRGTGEAIGFIGLNISQSAEDFGKFSAAIGMARQDTDALAASMVDKLIGATLGLDRADLGVHQSLTALSDTLKQNGLAIDKHTNSLFLNTKQGEENRGAILNVVSANVAQYDAQIKAGISAQDAAAAYDQNTAALESQMRQAGYTQAQIDGLIGKYRGVPKNVDTDIEIHGLAEAINNLDHTLRLINGLHDTSVTVTTYFRTVGSSTGAPGGLRGGVAAYAHGGVIGAEGGGPRSNLTLVGEQGPELVSLPYGSTVHSAGDSMRMAARSAQGGSDGAAQGVSVSFSGAIDRAVSDLVMKLIRDGFIQIKSSQIRS